MIHSYESFLAANNPALRKNRGVWYTPQVAVSFIVRAVDDILQTDFDLPMGLADTNVSILDPATGAGTFLVETVKQIYDKFSNKHDHWQEYVQEHLLLRLHGFEILTEPYEMACRNLTELLRQTGCMLADDQRFRVCQVNALQEPFFSTDCDTPVMAVLGNPPYNVSTQNKNDWIDGLMADYKKGLNEKNIQPLSDDYIKFIRYGQHVVEKNGTGLLAYISNNSFIDGLIHRQMRKTLLEAFDKIYVFDLHGNTNRKEIAPDGGKDENVFDIRQGVSINLFIKTGQKTKNVPATVLHSELYGKRTEKYDFLSNNSLRTVSWRELDIGDDNYFFVPKDFRLKVEYEKGFKINELFSVYSSGIKTHDDAYLVSFLPFPENNQVYAYRPFDVRFINYDLKQVKRHRNEFMKHFMDGENIGLLTCRQQSGVDFRHVFVSCNIIDMGTLSNLPSETTYVFPLYRYSVSGTRTSNLHKTIIGEICRQTGLRLSEERKKHTECFAPIDLFDYIYAILHSPAYRKRYKEFLKIDFPRVPYPEDAERFWTLVRLGKKLRRLHLLENVEPQRGLADYNVKGDNVVAKHEYKNGKVWINTVQFFDNVPPEVWNFHIGGYQPAQKWLKDRKRMTLTFDDIQHYQKIILVLQETKEVMSEADALHSF